MRLTKQTSGVRIVVFEPVAGGCGAAASLGSLGTDASIEVVAEAEDAAALGGTAVSESTQPYVPIALPCNTSTFEQGGWEACLGAYRGHSL